MKQLRNLWIAILVGGAGAWSSACADSAVIKIIAHPSVPVGSTTSAEIKAVFLETKNSLSDGSRVQPVILRGSACEAFARSYLGKTAIGLETYYRGLVFSGTGVIPKAMTSENEVIAYIARTRGAIGYVSGTATTKGVKVLTVR